MEKFWEKVKRLEEDARRLGLPAFRNEPDDGALSSKEEYENAYADSERIDRRIKQERFWEDHP